MPHSPCPAQSLSHPSHINQQGKYVISFIIVVAIIVGLTALGFYLVKQDRIITSKFEGKRWNIPAKVYSQPLNLYVGENLPTENLDNWLELLNYRNVTPNAPAKPVKKNKKAVDAEKTLDSSANMEAGKTGLDSTGTYQKVGNDYIIHARQFTFTQNDIEPKQLIKVSIKDNQIAKVQSTQPNSTGVARLEPILIGGIYPDNNEDRIVLNLKDIPQPLIDALVATEDRGFYEHHGVSVKGIVRAIYSNLTGGMRQGGSTITQQLIKNFYLSSDRTFKRKANEAAMAVLLELHYSKNDILQTYMNEINLGQNGSHSINGFGLASQFYFDQPLNELRLDQMALLVGLAKGPSQYNPLKNPQLALERRNVVLNNMLVMGKITQADYDTAIKQPLSVVKNPVIAQTRFPDFLDIVKRELNQYYKADDLKNEGMRIFSTLDPNAQLIADKAVNQSLIALRKSNPKQLKDLQAALVTANPQTGELLATVGSGSEFTGFNRAVDAHRPVGSILKPFIYLTALEQGDYNIASGVDDSPISIKVATKDNPNETWTPLNYDRTSHGTVPLMGALANSYNQAAVRVGMQAGLPNVINQLHQLGIKDNIPPYPATLLGGVSLTPMDMLGVYQVLASGGFKHNIHTIRAVTDSQAHLVKGNELQNEQVTNPAAAYITNYALQQVIKEGTAKPALALGETLNLAGKTGTTNDYRDAWFAGYSGNYVSVVWVGRDDNQPIGLSGGNGALPMWINFMGKLSLTPVNLPTPPSIEWHWLENGTGKLTNENCPNALYLPIDSQKLPEESSECANNAYEQEQQIRLNAQRAKDQSDFKAGNPLGNSLEKSNQSYEDMNRPSIANESNNPSSLPSAPPQGTPETPQALNPQTKSEDWLQQTNPTDN